MSSIENSTALARYVTIGAGLALTLSVGPAAAQGATCPVTHAQLQAALSAAAPDGAVNGGLNNNMWATVVNRDGIVCNIARTGPLNGQWPLSRVISAQKAHTAWSLSLDQGQGGTVDALSTANLWAATQPGGSLWELTQSNPVDATKAYRGARNTFGTRGDPLRGTRLGGVNVFGGGLALYNEAGQIVGGLGASGDTSCADHNIAWRVRDGLGLDYVPSGVGTPADNIIFDLLPVDNIDGMSPGMDHFNHPVTVSASGFGHPVCGFNEEARNPDIVGACPTGDGTTQSCSML